MHKIKSFWNKIVLWSLKKKIIYGVVAVLVLFMGYGIFGPKDNSANITSDIVKRVDLKQTVLATGQVTSTTDLSLSFYSSGIVRSLRVKVGDKVKAGQIIANLDQGNELASLTSARGAVAAAEARYQKILSGYSNEEISLAKISLENAERDYERVKSQQETLVKNAYKSLLNSSLEALPNFEYSSYTAPTISGNYNLEKEGQIIVHSYSSAGGSNFSTNGILNTSGLVSSTPQPIGDSGLYISFPATYNQNITEWVINIPNTKASNYVSNYNAYQAALKTQENVLGNAKALIDQRRAELAIKQSAARTADIELAEADILTAQGQLQSATANFEHTILRAPTGGTITKIDIKLGELAQAQKEVVTLQDVDNLYLEANINEANIISIVPDAKVEINFDAFGTDKVFSGRVLNIDPSSTLISGVVNYKVTANVDDQPELRPGMTANMTILTGEKSGILVVPSRAVLIDQSGNKTIRIITNTKTKAFKEVPVVTGMEGDGGLVEVISGVNEGDEIVVLIKK